MEHLLLPSLHNSNRHWHCCLSLFHGCSASWSSCSLAQDRGICTRKSRHVPAAENWL